MPVTYKQIADAVEAAFKTIKIANGYSTDLPDANFFRNYDQNNLNKSKPETYPKTFITSGDVVPVAQNNSRKRVTETFYVTCVVLEVDRNSKSGSSVDAQTQVKAIADDVEKMLVSSYTLGGLVVSADLVSVSFDAGFAHPEGIVIFELNLTYFKQY